VTADEAGPPVLRVVRGEPDAAETAALVAVLTARAGTAAVPAPDGTTSTWSDHAWALRRGGEHGHGAWRASSWPH